MKDTEPRYVVDDAWSSSRTFRFEPCMGERLCAELWKVIYQDNSRSEHRIGIMELDELIETLTALRDDMQAARAAESSQPRSASNAGRP